MIYDNIRSHKKGGLHPLSVSLSKMCLFGKKSHGGQIDPNPHPPSLFRVKPEINENLSGAFINSIKESSSLTKNVVSSA